jgi:hypothetical protein
VYDPATVGRIGPCGKLPFTVTYYEDITFEHCKDWVVDDCIGVGEMSAWYGWPGAGKSVVLGDAAAHVAASLVWFGHHVTGGGVLYIAAERGAVVKRRFAAWRKHHGLERIPLAVLDGAAFDLFSGPDHADAIAAVGKQLADDFETSIRLVIIDTKTRVMGGGDPNTDADIMGLVTNCQRLQAALAGPHIAITDHVPYASPERLKGSGALAGAIDTSFLIRKESEGVHTVIIGSKPPNDGPADFSLTFSLKSVDLGVDERGKKTTAPVVIPADADDAPASSRSRRTPGVQKVMAAFGRLWDAGKTYPAPAVPGVWPDTRAVTHADLREMALKLGLYAHPEPDDAKEHKRWLNGRNQAWKRANDEVQRAGALRFEDGFFWEPRAVTRAVTGGDER